MTARPFHPATPRTREAGMTLIEVTIVIGMLAAIMMAITTILMSSVRVESRTIRRAKVQSDVRQTLALMTREIRQAGMDPHDPPTGACGVVSADARTLHFRADLDANGVIATAEPSEDVMYRYDAVNKTVTRNPGTGAVAILDRVSDLTLEYFDQANQPVTPLPLSAANAARVRSIGLTIRCQDRNALPLTLQSRIALRNL